MVTRKLRGTHAGIAWSAGAWVDRAFPLARTAQPESSGVATSCLNDGRMRLARRPMSDPEADQAKTGKTAIRDGEDFSRGFFTLLSDDRIDLMERIGPTWDAQEKS